MNKTYFKCSSRLVILIFSLQILFNSCSDKNDFFNEKITIIENNPDKFLAQFDTTHQSNITDEHGATLYLLKSLAKYHLNPMNKPIKTEITQCIEIFYNTKSYNKLLKSLLVLAEIYKHENDIEHEIETIKEAIDIASANDDNIGLFYLYNYLSNMYNRQYDLVEYSRYQSLVNKYSENIDIALTNIETKLIIAQNKIYTHDIDNAIKILNIIEKEIKDSDIN